MIQGKIYRQLCDDCAGGGITLPTGLPGTNGANGGIGPTGNNGADGISFGYTITALSSPTCDCGGYRIEIGPDTDGDGVNDSITNTLDICTGCDGPVYEFGFPVILMVYDDPTDPAKFSPTGLGLGIYDGWAIANGDPTNGTVDLRGKFPVFWNNADADYDVVGDIGGSKTVTLTKAQLPVHKHVIGTVTDGASMTDGVHNHPYINYPSQAAVGSGGSSATRNDVATAAVTSSSGSHTHTGNTGDGTTDGLLGSAHENRPPFFTLLPIQKI